MWRSPVSWEDTRVVNDYPGFIANRILMPMIKRGDLQFLKGAGVQEIIP